MLGRLERQSKLVVTIAAYSLLAGIGVVDYWTGNDISLSLFYLIPVFMVTQRVGRRLGILTSLASSIIGLLAAVLQARSLLFPLSYVWNALLTFGFLAIIVFLLSALNKALEEERELARTDPLTGVANSRFFSQILQTEIDRSQRYKHPFTLAYLDVDNFKTVNDKFGHFMGDRVLRTIATEAGKNLRKTDVIARLGGDEFAFLLPETDQESAQVVLTNIRRVIREAMELNN